MGQLTLKICLHNTAHLLLRSKQGRYWLTSFCQDPASMMMALRRQSTLCVFAEKNKVDPLAVLDTLRELLQVILF